MTSATRRSAIPARTRSTPAWRAHGGFDHNSHGLRLVTELERRYADFDGLNLTQETIEGLVKHNGPLIDAEGRPLGAMRERGVPEAILAYDRRQSLELAAFASLEAQAAAIADDIAYDAHDIDDGLRAGLFDLEAIRARPVRRRAARRDRRAASRPGARARHSRTGAPRHHPLHRGRDWRKPRGASPPRASPASSDVAARGPGAGRPFAGAAKRPTATSRAFLFANMYRHPEVEAGARARPTRWCVGCSRPISTIPRRCRRTGRLMAGDGEASARAPSPTISPA